MEYTTNLNLKKPGQDDFYNIENENDNMDKIDAEIVKKADKTEVLTKTNTTAFTPTGDYQPATKKYVDDKASSNTVSLCQWHNGEFLGLGKFEGISSATAYSVTIPAGVSLVKVTYGSHVLDGWATNLVALRKNGTIIGYASDYTSGGSMFTYSGSSLNAQIVSVTAGDVLVLHASEAELQNVTAYNEKTLNSNVNTMPASRVPYCTMIVETIE